MMHKFLYLNRLRKMGEDFETGAFLGARIKEIPDRRLHYVTSCPG
jgi:hypothetical protein